jgi:hypothetical protein
MEDYTTYSRTWLDSKQNAYRLSTDGIQLSIQQCDYKLSRKKIISTDWMEATNTYCIWNVIGVLKLEHIEIPRSRWADISKQLSSGENWLLEGKI